MKLEVGAKIQRLPRVKLANLPTPLEEMPHLSRALGGPKLWIKRDDLTGPVFGGNKVRKLEFEMADAVQKGANIIVSGGVVQSNHARSTAVAARKLGMNVVLLLRGEKPEKYTGNLLIDRILGADIRFFRAESHEMGPITKKVVEELKAKGYNPYVVPFSSPLGSVGYVNAFLELHSQAKNMNFKVDYIVHAVGSGGTQAGFIVGNKALDTETNLIGVATEPDGDWLLNTTVEIANNCAKLLELETSITQADVAILHDYAGEEHGALNQGVKDAIKKAAEFEGILLDPVYTGKAMIGLINLVEQGRFGKRENIVFLHTGGIPAVFAYEAF
jgi:L-cysteate sulfo-lyase